MRAAARLAPAGVEIVLYEGLGGLPHFNPDLEGEHEPAAVTALRLAVREVDGLLVACPEYGADTAPDRRAVGAGGGVRPVRAAL